MSVPHACLLLRFAGFLQSWGGASEFDTRATGHEPTKSAVVGLLAAAQGRARTDPISDLGALQMGTRTDQPGRLLRDFHTAADYRDRPLPSAAVDRHGRQKPRTAKTPEAARSPKVTYRYYLQDAVFTAALIGPAPLIDTLAYALRHPAFPLALGRRSCPPSRPILLGTLDPDETTSLEHALTGMPWQAAKHHRKEQGATVQLAATIEDPSGLETRADVPESFDFHGSGRRSARRVRTTWLTVSTGAQPDGEPTRATHDPFALLGW